MSERWITFAMAAAKLTYMMKISEADGLLNDAIKRGEARAVAGWLSDLDGDCLISHYERRTAELVLEKAKAGYLINRRERAMLMRVVNRVRACCAEDPFDGWLPSAMM